MKILVFALFLVFSTPVYALTNSDITNEMSSKNAAFYIGATVEGMAFLASNYGRKKSAQCVMDWYFGSDESFSYIMQWLEKYPNETPQVVILYVVEKRCPGVRN